MCRRIKGDGYEGENLMREWTRQCRLEEAFRQELFRLINQYLSAPEDATLGKIVRKLVNFQQVSAAVENLCQNACMAFLPRTSSRQSSMDISPTISPCSDSGATYPAIGPNSASGWASPQPGLIESIAVPLNSEHRNRHPSGEAKLRVMTISANHPTGGMERPKRAPQKFPDPPT